MLACCSYLERTLLKHTGDVSLMQAVGSLMFSSDGTARGQLNDDSRALMSPDAMDIRCVSDTPCMMYIRTHVC